MDRNGNDCHKCIAFPCYIDPARDFYPNSGKTKLGETKGLFARYGLFKEGYLKEINPSDLTAKYGGSLKYFSDDRFFAWPDFMNKQKEFWRNDENPFKDLPLLWQNPTTKQYFPWSDRPMSWEGLSLSPKLKETVRAEKLQDTSLETMAKQNQMDADQRAPIAPKLMKNSDNPVVKLKPRPQGVRPFT